MGKRRINSWIVALVRPPLLLAGLVFGVIYRLWFLKGDEQLARKLQDDLAQAIRLSIPFLFHDCDGKIVHEEHGSDFPPPFDYATVTVEFLNLRARFTRGRETLSVFLAPTFSPQSWHELSTILSVLDSLNVRRGSITDLKQAGKLIEQHVSELAQVLCESEYPRLTAELQEIRERDRIVTRQLETEINRRVYG